MYCTLTYKVLYVIQTHMNMDALIRSVSFVTRLVSVRVPLGIKYLILSIWVQQILTYIFQAFGKQNTPLMTGMASSLSIHYKCKSKISHFFKSTMAPQKY